MADREDLSAAGDQASSDEETVKGDRESEHIAEILEEERLGHPTPVPLGNGSVTNRYREILQGQEDGSSEEGSVLDAVPKRVGSPIDSLLSVPDDSPSAQVR
jgi:vacuolar protein sorting-associated protein 8